QAKEIVDLKKRVQRLERKKKSRTTGLKRLKKVGMSRRVESSESQESLGDHEDASKQGRSIEDIDANAEKEEQSIMIGEAVAVTTAGVEESVAPTIPITVEETLAQTLIEIKAAKPKAKGIIFHDQEEQRERPLTKKDQVAIDEDLASNIQAQLDAEIIEEERLERQKQEEANIALIES
ncbi:hypothetical protein Tco_0511495, partial [Tanacetum coccineum]